MFHNFKPRLKTCTMCVERLKNSRIFLRFFNEIYDFRKHQETIKSFQTFYLKKPKTGAMFSPVPKRTASHLVPSTHSNEIGRNFGMQTCAQVPLGGITRPPFFVLASVVVNTFLHAKVHLPLLDKMPSRWEVHLLIIVKRAAPEAWFTVSRQLQNVSMDDPPCYPRG